jgi:dUTP pyrophosphatase
MHQKPTVRINVVDDRAVLPAYGTELSAGFDLAIIEDAVLGPLEAKVFSTGLIIQAPHDHMVLVAPRSSTWRKWHVHLGNTVGIVDEDFCGPDDVAQGIFVPITRATFEVVDGPIAKTRGGWGSTGD